MARHRRMKQMDSGMFERASLVTDWIRRECLKRGYSLKEDADDPGSLWVSIGNATFELKLTEEVTTQTRVKQVQVDEAKYDWQRVSPSYEPEPNGRLHLQLVTYRDPYSWADRSRWTLMDKLPEMMDNLEARAARQREAQEILNTQHELDVLEWTKAVEVARDRCLEERNRERIRAQAEAWSRAEGLRDYARAVRESGDSPEWREWAARIEDEAERIDPIGRADSLPSPDERDGIAWDELDRYMPKGWTALRPPEVGQARW